MWTKEWFLLCGAYYIFYILINSSKIASMDIECYGIRIYVKYKLSVFVVFVFILEFLSVAFIIVSNR